MYDGTKLFYSPFTQPPLPLATSPQMNFFVPLVVFRGTCTRVELSNFEVMFQWLKFLIRQFMVVLCGGSISEAWGW